MSANPKSVQIGQALSDVYHIMKTSGIHHVPVLNKKELVGLISFTDMMPLNFTLQGYAPTDMAGLIDQQFEITEIMSKQLITLNIEQSIKDAVELLATGTYHALPVTDHKNHLMGVVTSTDLIRYLKDQY